MGVIRQYRCPSCQNEWQLAVGHGMKHGVLGRVMEAFSEDIQKKIIKEVDGGQLPLFHFNYEAAVCRQCRIVTAVPVLKFIESGKFYVGSCPQCGSVLEFPEEDTLIVCPDCEKAELDIRDVGRWD